MYSIAYNIYTELVYIVPASIGLCEAIRWNNCKIYIAPSKSTRLRQQIQGRGHADINELPLGPSAKITSACSQPTPTLVRRAPKVSTQNNDRRLHCVVKNAALSC